MKLAKAKEIMELNVKDAGRHMPHDVLDALKLHIESMNFFQEWRKGRYFPADYMLPGEDKGEQSGLL